MVTMAIAILGGVSSLVLTIFGWIGKGVMVKQESHTESIAESIRRLAVLEASTLPTRIIEHDVRLTVVEKGISELSGDVRVIRSIVERLDNKPRKGGHGGP